MTESRDLNWPHCLNARDFGGLLTVSGAETQRGRLVRSDTPGRLNASGRNALLAYGIRTVIDLRRPNEVADEPHAFVRSPSPLQYVNIPLEKFYPHVSAKIVKARSRGEVYCIILDHYPDRVAGVLRAFGTAGPGGVLIHCHSGKDRTGMIAALILRLSGVPASTVIQDYALSQVRLSAGDDANYSDADEEPGDFWNRPTALPEMMGMLLEYLDATYGSVEKYLEQAGLTLVEQDQIRQRLLIP